MYEVRMHAHLLIPYPCTLNIPEENILQLQCVTVDKFERWVQTEAPTQLQNFNFIPPMVSTHVNYMQY